jgi:uncharacterized protein (DUF885 family)
MSDTVDQLAVDYQEHRLRSMPTWAHMIGEYAYADRFDEVGREAEDRLVEEARGFVARAEALADADLDEQQRITRAMVAWDAGSRVAMLSARMAELAADPVFGPQASLGVRIPKLALPDAGVAEAMVDKLRGVATYFSDLAARHREGVASGRTPAAFAVDGTVAQLDAWLASPVDEDPLLNISEPPAGVDAADLRVRDLGGGRARIEVPAGDLPRAAAVPGLLDVLSPEGFTAGAVELAAFRSGALNDVLAVSDPPGRPRTEPR